MAKPGSSSKRKDVPKSDRIVHESDDEENATINPHTEDQIKEQIEEQGKDQDLHNLPPSGQQDGIVPPQTQATTPAAPTKAPKPPEPTSTGLLLPTTQNCGRVAKALAGYLGCQKTSELKTIIDSDPIKHATSHWAVARDCGFGVADFKPSSQIQNKRLFQILSRSDTTDSAECARFDKLFNLRDCRHNDERITDAGIPIDGDFPFFYTMSIAKVIIDELGLDQKSLPADRTYTNRGSTWEDWHRAICLIRFTHFFNDKEIQYQGPAQVISYLPVPVSGTPGTETTVSMDALEIQLALELEEDRSDDDDNYKIPTTAEEWNEAGEDELRDDNEDIELAITKAMHKAKRATTQPDPRAPIRPETIRAFLRLKRDKVKHRVVYDSASTNNKASPSALLAPRNSLNDDATKTAATEDEANLDHTTQFTDSELTVETQLDTEEFLQLRRELGDTTSPYEPYETACDALGFTDEEARSRSLYITNPSDPSIKYTNTVPTPLQVVAVNWMRGMEAGPLHGGALAMDVGTGKTITCIWNICLRAADHRRSHENNIPMKHTPVLVLSPNEQVLQVWWREFKRFKGACKVYIYHGSAGECRELDKKNATLENDAEKARKFLLNKYPDTDPSSAAVVVLTTYATFAARTLAPTSRAEEIKTLTDTAQIACLEDFDTRKLDTTKHTPSEIAWMEKMAISLLRDAKPSKSATSKSTMDEQTDEEALDIDSNTMVLANRMRGVFGAVYCDEGHFIKNATTRFHTAVYTLYSPVIWVVSATPANNSVSDFTGMLHLLWRDTFMPEEKFKKAHNRLDLYTPEFTTQFFADHPEYLEEFLGIEAWKLCPRNFVWLHNTKQFYGTTAKRVLITVIRSTCLRLTTATKLDVFGHEFVLGSTIPPYSVSTVELRHASHGAAMYSNIHDGIVGLLHRHSKEEGGHLLPKATVDKKGLRNARIHRQLILSSNSLRLAALNNALRGKKANSAAVALWHGKHNDNGLTFYMRNTKFDPFATPATDRITAANYIVNPSPKYEYLCGLVEDHVYAKGEKLVVWYEYPFEGFELCLLFRTLCIEIFFIGSFTSIPERTSIIESWGQEEHPTRILIASTLCVGYGVNMQSGCHLAALMSLPHNINNYIQIVGRQHRYGQQHPQKVWILTTVETYDQMVQAKACVKMLVQLLGDAATTDLDIEPDEEVREKIRSLVNMDNEDDIICLLNECKDEHLIKQVDEKLQKLLGQRCSRLGWDDSDVKAVFKKSMRSPTDKDEVDPNDPTLTEEQHAAALTASAKKNFVNSDIYKKATTSLQLSQSAKSSRGRRAQKLNSSSLGADDQSPTRSPASSPLPVRVSSLARSSSLSTAPASSSPDSPSANAGKRKASGGHTGGIAKKVKRGKGSKGSTDKVAQGSTNQDAVDDEEETTPTTAPGSSGKKGKTPRRSTRNKN